MLNRNPINIDREQFGKILRKQRLECKLTLQDLSKSSGVSSSYLARIENGERFPSATVLQKVAEPLGFNEGELFILAGYLSSYTLSKSRVELTENRKTLDPYVAAVLSQEKIEVQRVVVNLLSVAKSLAANLSGENL